MGAQGRAASKDYHGGASLAIFIDNGGDQDVYSNGANNEITCRDEYGIRADLGGMVEEILKNNNYLKNTPSCMHELSPDL